MHDELDLVEIGFALTSTVISLSPLQCSSLYEYELAHRDWLMPMSPASRSWPGKQLSLCQA